MSENDPASPRRPDIPGVETVGTGGGPRDNPTIPCHGCGDEERFTVMKQRDDWRMEYRDGGEWVAFCPDCVGDDGGQ
jgi:hypothetical protein